MIARLTERVHFGMENEPLWDFIRQGIKTAFKNTTDVIGEDEGYFKGGATIISANGTTYAVSQEAKFFGKVVHYFAKCELGDIKTIDAFYTHNIVEGCVVVEHYKRLAETLVAIKDASVYNIYKQYRGKMDVFKDPFTDNYFALTEFDEVIFLKTFKVEGFVRSEEKK